MRHKWKGILGGIFVAGVLSACGGSNEDQMMGLWQEVSDGEKKDTFIEIGEDRFVIRDGATSNPNVTEYRVTDTPNDRFIVDLVHPRNGSYEFAFEGIFESKDKILLESEGDRNGENSFNRIDSIDEAIEEMENEG